MRFSPRIPPSLCRRNIRTTRRSLPSRSTTTNRRHGDGGADPLAAAWDVDCGGPARAVRVLAGRRRLDNTDLLYRENAEICGTSREVPDRRSWPYGYGQELAWPHARRTSWRRDHQLRFNRGLPWLRHRHGQSAD